METELNHCREEENLTEMEDEIIGHVAPYFEAGKTADQEFQAGSGPEAGCSIIP